MLDEKDGGLAEILGSETRACMVAVMRNDNARACYLEVFGIRERTLLRPRKRTVLRTYKGVFLVGLLVAGSAERASMCPYKECGW